MQNTKALMTQMYASFNSRDIEGTLAFMSDGVDWPKASEGGRAKGKDEIREYWTRQWAEIDPHVEPIEIIDQDDGKTAVRVHQLVKNLEGAVIFEQDVWHIYTIKDGLVERMDINESDGSGKSSTPNIKFSSP